MHRHTDAEQWRAHGALTAWSYQRASQPFHVKLSKEAGSLSLVSQEHIFFILPQSLHQVHTDEQTRAVITVCAIFSDDSLLFCPSSKSRHRESTTVLLNQPISHYSCHFTSPWSQKPTSQILLDPRSQIVFYSLPLLWYWTSHQHFLDLPGDSPLHQKKQQQLINLRRQS